MESANPSQLSNARPATTLFPSPDLPSPAPSMTETDAGPLPPPYAMPSPPVTPPPPRVSTPAANSITLTISHPISISGNHNDINLAIPLESTLKNALSTISHSSKQMLSTSASQNRATIGSGGLQIMVHCPISIIGDCNNVSLEPEAEESTEIVYIPAPTAFPPYAQRPHVSPRSRSQSTCTSSVPYPPRQPQPGAAASISPPQLSIPLAQTIPEMRKRCASPNRSTHVDVAPFTSCRDSASAVMAGVPKRPRTESTANERPDAIVKDEKI